MLGTSGRNLVVASDPAWAAAFDDERRRLLPALAGLATSIEHYGSTAVPGLKAKPIIDILVGIDAIAEWAACQEPLRRLGYVYFADAGVDGHYVFSRGIATTDRTHLLHIVEHGSPNWSLNLAFRDELRRNPSLRAQYELQKEQAASQAPTDRIAYNALKSSFIRAAMADLK